MSYRFFLDCFVNKICDQEKERTKTSFDQKCLAVMYGENKNKFWSNVFSGYVWYKGENMKLFWSKCVCSCMVRIVWWVENEVVLIKGVARFVCREWEKEVVL